MKLIPKRKVSPKEFPEFAGEGDLISYGDIVSYITQMSDYITYSSQFISNLYTTIEYINNYIRVITEFTGNLDDILDGITYGRVLQTNLSSGALKIITSQIALLNLIPATDDTSYLGSVSKLWRLLYVHDILLNSDILPASDDTSYLGLDSRKLHTGYIKRLYADTRMKIPGGTDMYD